MSPRAERLIRALEKVIEVLDPPTVTPPPHWSHRPPPPPPKRSEFSEPTIELRCSCVKLKGWVFSWYRDVPHTEVCRVFRRTHPQYVEPVKHPETESMMMTSDEFDRRMAFEPVAAWRWRWRQPANAWVKVLAPRI